MKNHQNSPFSHLHLRTRLIVLLKEYLFERISELINEYQVILFFVFKVLLESKY